VSDKQPTIYKHSCRKKNEKFIIKPNTSNTETANKYTCDNTWAYGKQENGTLNLLTAIYLSNAT
jgi:hypothetical protein